MGRPSGGDQAPGGVGATGQGGLTIDALGLLVRIEGELITELADELGDLATEAHPAMSVRVDRSQGGWVATDESGTAIARAASGPALVEGLVTRLNFLALDHDAARLHLHAALVERDGRGVILCGPSGAGKTTLAATMVQRGWNYVTDELVTLSPGCRAVPAYPKPFTFKGWAIDRFCGEFAEALPSRPERIAWRASKLGPIAHAAVPSIIVFPTFDADGGFSTSMISRTDALHRLTGQLMDAQRFGDLTLDLLAALASRTALCDMRYDDADVAADAVESLTPEARARRWSMGRSDGAARRVELDGRSIVLDLTAGTLTSGLAATDARVGRDRPDGDVTSPDLVDAPPIGQVLAQLTEHNIQFVLAGDIVESADGLQPVIQTHVLGSDLITSRPDRVRSLLPLGGHGDRVRVTDRIADPSAEVLVGVSMGFAHVLASAVPVRVDGNWYRALHPRHRFLWTCLEVGWAVDAGEEALASVIRAGQLTDPWIDQALDEAAVCGFLDSVRKAVVRAAESVPGTRPHLAAEIRRRGTQTHR